MKIAADYYNKGLGKSLSFLVGALVLGTALPHILNAFPSWSSPQHVIFGTSLLAIVGGLTMVLFVPKGPYSIEKKEFQWNAITTIFKNKKFNKAAIGYFGHMWELYTFWAYVPIIIGFYASLNSVEHFNIPLLSFFVIAIGSLGCVLSGFMSSHFRSKRITLIALSVSGICCLISPLSYSFSPALFLLFLLIWGIAVIADSPIFSSLIAKNAVPKLKGTALTIVNGIGFSITIISIQLVSFLSEIFSIQSLLVPLILGPIIGLLAMRKF
jgi:MFS family permease